MDAKLSGEWRNFNNAEASNGVGKKKSLEWDLNDWKWDGHNFVATPLNVVPSDCRNKQLVVVPASNSPSSCSGETDLAIVQKERGELEKRRKILAVEDDGLCGEDRSLGLKLCGHNCPIPEGERGNNGKRCKVLGGNSSRSVCQVDECEVDSSSARDYHRRHKVCEMMPRQAGPWSTMQRFCQQCSRSVRVKLTLF